MRRSKYLAEAKQVWKAPCRPRDRTAHTWVDYDAAIKKLHAAAGSPSRSPTRSSCQTSASTRSWRFLPGLREARPGPATRGSDGRRRGRERRDFIARFDDGAGGDGRGAEGGRSLKNNYIGMEHPMLAIVKRGVDGVDYDAARARSSSGSARATSRGSRDAATVHAEAKRVLETALNDAVDGGRESSVPPNSPGARVRLKRDRRSGPL